ncbi:MAG: ribonuclease P protein component [Candidatus Dojkabacteria bacterium]|nr:ribonuclease P protein component [Candidatus Dojkabacteria bacterium]
MLPKNFRLNSNLIKYVLLNGEIVLKNEFFIIKGVCYESLNNSRFAIIVSKRVAKKSTQRNRIKRLIREWIKRNYILFSPGAYVVIARKYFSQLSN